MHAFAGLVVREPLACIACVNPKKGSVSAYRIKTEPHKVSLSSSSETTQTRNAWFIGVIGVILAVRNCRGVGSLYTPLP